jgi:hypothetical protein
VTLKRRPPTPVPSSTKSEPQTTTKLEAEPRFATAGNDSAPDVFTLTRNSGPKTGAWANPIAVIPEAG